MLFEHSGRFKWFRTVSKLGRPALKDLFWLSRLDSQWMKLITRPDRRPYGSSVTFMWPFHTGEFVQPRSCRAMIHMYISEILFDEACSFRHIFSSVVPWCLVGEAFVRLQETNWNVTCTHERYLYRRIINSCRLVCSDTKDASSKRCPPEDQDPEPGLQQWSSVIRYIKKMYHDSILLRRLV